MAIVQQLSASDYLAGSLAMSLIAVVRDAFAECWKRVAAWVRRRLWISIHLGEKEAELLLAWLRERPEVHSAPSLTLVSRSTAHGNRRHCEYEPEVRRSMKIRVTSKGGTAQWMWITQKGSDVEERRPRSLTVSFLGRRKAVLEEIINEGREIQRRKREKYLTVVQVYDFGKEHGLGWLHPQESDRKQPGRSISSVVLPRGPASQLDQAEALLEDAREFLASEGWYTERGIPYRRGYLLHGIPGGGKSSLIVAVASELRLPIYMLQLSSDLMNDETLNALLQHGMHDPPTILLLEDVDLLHSATHSRVTHLEPIEDRDRDERRRKGRLSLSGLLNALDGPTATTGRLLFMTTNAKDRLDPALLRSGRIDYEIEFKAAEPEQVQRLFSRFYSDFTGRAVKDNAGITLMADEREDLARRFAEQVAQSGKALTTADIQRHLMKHKKEPARAVSALSTLLQGGSGF